MSIFGGSSFGLPRTRPLSSKRAHVVSVLDIGTTKVVCIIARLTPRRETSVLPGRTHNVEVIGLGQWLDEVRKVVGIDARRNHGGVHDVFHTLAITQGVNTRGNSALLQRGEGVGLVAGNEDDVRRCELRHSAIHIHLQPPLDQQGGVIEGVLVALVDVTCVFKSHQLDPEVADQAQLGFRAGH